MNKEVLQKVKLAGLQLNKSDVKEIPRPAPAENSGDFFKKANGQNNRRQSEIKL